MVLRILAKKLPHQQSLSHPTIPHLSIFLASSIQPSMTIRRNLTPTTSSNHYSLQARSVYNLKTTRCMHSLQLTSEERLQLL